MNFGDNVVWTLPTTHAGWAYVAKINGMGQAQWASYYAPSNPILVSYGYDVGVDASNDIYFV